MAFFLIGIAIKFVLSILSEQNLNQFNVQFVLKETQYLINTVVVEKMQQVSNVLAENNLDPEFLLSDVLENGIHLNVFENLKNQRAQNTQFTSKLGMIIPRVTLLPVSAADFGRYNN